MKKLLVLGFTVFTVCALSTVQGQGNSQKTKDEKISKTIEPTDDKVNKKIDVNEEKGKVEMPQDKNKKNREEKEHSKTSESKGKGKGKGNAYGKNKGDLSGREFGQQRASEARTAGQSRREEAEKKIIVQEKQIKENEEKIIVAKEKLQKLEVNKQITPVELKNKRDAIAEAETKVKQVKLIVENEKKELEKLIISLQ